MPFPKTKWQSVLENIKFTR
uniref:Uncharacterized protein n=1 Tax=Anguilla anguilla TaxID=7936 RepID=A0A0E9RYJ8_ANGAN